MADRAPTPDELTALLATLLAGAAGKDEAFWTELVTIERTSIRSDVQTNWRLRPSGDRDVRSAVASADKIVRGAHPYVRWAHPYGTW